MEGAGCEVWGLGQVGFQVVFQRMCSMSVSSWRLRKLDSQSGNFSFVCLIHLVYFAKSEVFGRGS